MSAKHKETVIKKMKYVAYGSQGNLTGQLFLQSNGIQHVYRREDAISYLYHDKFVTNSIAYETRNFSSSLS